MGLHSVKVKILEVQLFIGTHVAGVKIAVKHGDLPNIGVEVNYGNSSLESPTGLTESLTNTMNKCNPKPDPKPDLKPDLKPNPEHNH